MLCCRVCPSTALNYWHCNRLICEERSGRFAFSMMFHSSTILPESEQSMRFPFGEAEGYRDIKNLTGVSILKKVMWDTPRSCRAILWLYIFLMFTTAYPQKGFPNSESDMFLNIFTYQSLFRHGVRSLPTSDCLNSMNTPSFLAHVYTFKHSDCR